MSRSVFRAEVPVEGAFDLRLTAQALQRLSTNVVDVVTPDGTYRRAVMDRGRAVVLRIRQSAPRQLNVAFDGARSLRLLSLVKWMLGADVDVRAWERRVASIPWLRDLTRLHRGLRPPRYPTLWEAVAHSIVFQQISLHAAAAIMQRFVCAVSSAVEDDGIVLYPFPSPQAVADASPQTLLEAGLSRNKALALQQAALAFSRREIDAAALQRLSSAQAIAELSRLRGIGPWSAAVILLRGLGRLDVFPLNDSGVAASLKLLAGDATVDLNRLLLQLGDQRGMLYFHLLIGRIAHAERKNR